MMEIEMMDGGILTGSEIEVYGDTMLVSGVYNVPIDDVRRITVKEA